MNNQDRSDLKKCRTVLIQSNDPRFNFAMHQEEDIKNFKQQPDIISMDRYDYGFKKTDGTDTELPEITPFSLLASCQNLEDLEEWYRHKHPNLPEEYYGVMARYTVGKEITKKEAKNHIKRFKKKGGNKEPPVGFKIIKGPHTLEFN
jgi:hypothetical protein